MDHNLLWIPEGAQAGRIEHAMPTALGQINEDLKLTAFTRRYRPVGFIADVVAPLINKTGVRESFTYYIWEKSNAFRVYDDQRAPGTPAKKIVAKMTKTSSLLAEHALSTLLSDRERQEYGDDTSIDQNQTEFLADALAINREIRVASIFESTTNLAATHYVDKTGSQITTATTVAALKALINTAIQAVMDDTGQMANTWIMHPSTAYIVGTILQDLIKYIVDAQGVVLKNPYGLPESLWGLKIVIPTPVYNSSKVEGTMTGASIWGKHMHVAYLNPSASPMPNQMAPAYTFNKWFRRVRTWQDMECEASAWEVSDLLKELECAPDARYLLQNINA